jgi:hypothetical protein
MMFIREDEEATRCVEEAEDDDEEDSDIGYSLVMGSKYH